MKAFALGLVAILCGCGSIAFAQCGQFEEWYLQTPDSTDIYVREFGRGIDTVIVIHGGFGANHDYMLDAVSGLENQHHFVFYDQRGSLMSPATLDKITFSKNVDDLDHLLKELKIARAKLMAHSMGTLVAMEYNHLHPDKVSHLILIGAIPAQADSLSSIFSKQVDQNIHTLVTRDAVKNRLNRYTNKPDSLLTSKERTDRWRIQFASTNIYQMEHYAQLRGGWAYYKQDASVMLQTLRFPYDYRPGLQRNGKVTLIQGDRDFLDFDAAKHKSLLKPYPLVQIVLIKNAGHNIWVDDAIAFKTELEKALRR